MPEARQLPSTHLDGTAQELYGAEKQLTQHSSTTEQQRSKLLLQVHTRVPSTPLKAVICWQFAGLTHTSTVSHRRPSQMRRRRARAKRSAATSRCCAMATSRFCPSSSCAASSTQLHCKLDLLLLVTPNLDPQRRRLAGSRVA